MKSSEARAAFAADVERHEALGVFLPGVETYTPEEWKRDYRIAMDAQPQLLTTPNSALPWFLTATIDPTIYRILFSPNKAAKIIGEVKKGDWTMDTTMFPVIEHVGEVSSYGDYNENGHVGANIDWPARQNYIFQTMEEIGDRELERAGLAKVNWVTEQDQAAATVMDKFMNNSYFFGIAGIQNYGLLNDPLLSAALTPVAKAGGGVKWITAGVVTATANEIYTDIQSLFAQLVAQTGGLIEATDAMVLAMSPGVAVALTTTNAFNVNVSDLLKKNFPSLTIETAIQFGVTSASNPQGIAAGNMIMLIAKTIDGQQTGFAAYSEKMRAHPIVRGSSSFRKKLTGGTWGTVLRAPFALATMVGV